MIKNDKDYEEIYKAFKIRIDQLDKLAAGWLPMVRSGSEFNYYYAHIQCLILALIKDELTEYRKQKKEVQHDKK